MPGWGQGQEGTWRRFQPPGQPPGFCWDPPGPVATAAQLRGRRPHPGPPASAAVSVSPSPRPLLRQRPIKLMKRPFPKAGTIFQSPEAPLPSSTPSPCSLVGLPPPPLPSPSPASPGPVTRPRVPQILGYRELAYWVRAAGRWDTWLEREEGIFLHQSRNFILSGPFQGEYSPTFHRGENKSSERFVTCPRSPG